MDGFTQFLKAEYGDVPHEENFDFSLRSSIGVGGKARLAFFPRTAEEAVRLLDAFDGSGVHYHILGPKLRKVSSFLRQIYGVFKDGKKAFSPMQVRVQANFCAIWKTRN